jgi:hypothetical protein
MSTPVIVRIIWRLGRARKPILAGGLTIDSVFLVEPAAKAQVRFTGLTIMPPLAGLVKGRGVELML